MYLYSDLGILFYTIFNGMSSNNYRIKLIISSLAKFGLTPKLIIKFNGRTSIPNYGNLSDKKIRMLDPSLLFLIRTRVWNLPQWSKSKLCFSARIRRKLSLAIFINKQIFYRLLLKSVLKSDFIKSKEVGLLSLILISLSIINFINSTKGL